MNNKVYKKEYEGSSVEEAIQKAEAGLNVSRENFSISVITEESKGLFGMDGEKPAVIIVELKDGEK